MSTPIDDDQIEIIQEFVTESQDMIEQSACCRKPP